MPTATKTTCYHCGNDCYTEEFQHAEKEFCCSGCLSVYQILTKSNLSNYYKLNRHPGESRISVTDKYLYLDEEEFVNKLIDYRDSQKTILTFYIPAIHCSSCIWLLERLNSLDDGIIENRVDFLKKQVHIQFNQSKTSLRKLVELLASIGYEPLISLNDVIKENKAIKDDTPTKIAVAGFCFGNIMMLSFPSYFGLSEAEAQFGQFFGLINVLLCFPVFFYSGRDYFKNAYHSLANRVLDINFPLALGILVMFVRTLAEWTFGLGEGYADSLAGLVFFLNVGKYMQNRTYYHLSFERDYRSFFPVAVQVVKENGEEIPTPLENLKKGDRIRVKNQEIIPADSILLRGEGLIDFSFVTGESQPVNKVLGEIIYAGGRQTGKSLELEVVKPVSQSYLTSLWNNEVFDKHQQNKIKTFLSVVSHYFSIILLIIAFGSLIYWLPIDWKVGVSAFTAVLIIACPCALALSTPFTMSTALSILDKNKFYLKNTDVVEQLAAVNTITFDKTGTVSISEVQGVVFKGIMEENEKQLIYNVCKNSSHPHSIRISNFLGKRKDIKIDNYEEILGKGIKAIVEGECVLIGSSSFVTGISQKEIETPEVHIKIDNKYIGFFQIKQRFREDLDVLLTSLNKDYQTYLLSGDTEQDAVVLNQFFKSKDDLKFKQSPEDKLNFIKSKQENGSKVLMVGDGLNDSGALKQSDAGIAVTDNINNFTPGSDAVLDGTMLNKLPDFLRFCKSSVKVIHKSFCISLVYNVFGLAFAVSGQLSPLFAAILMPLSTITIISFTTLAVRASAKKIGLL
ncbi:E1-E2 ATPase-associated domain protein [Pseudopedobacter saltans DSM 12145]|uniref:E1-E2 ATPase-associated domain protein n=1 Tax=Pseudopedobacter saltans (strain ATCC 51119 / DSM 12145 / JCM 21818 / CCUG 39354 / LMG 10337 / NBRC 100064 / NCIMB 13643) TaxID=762903 RepID=F0S922_PSESL|nr:heavy metal translocating P-type ATPase metal-binding domain-containing protein [Pseudopedobacter saltans]ADY51320.1 E1-E2 ATPase-associated domain protein [Pseudopedobacter saltans DSM 12145]